MKIKLNLNIRKVEYSIVNNKNKDNIDNIKESKRNSKE